MIGEARAGVPSQRAEHAVVLPRYHDGPGTHAKFKNQSIKYVLCWHISTPDANVSFKFFALFTQCRTSYSRVYRRYTGVPKLTYGDRRTLTMTKYGLDRKPLVFRYTTGATLAVNAQGGVSSKY